MWLLGHTEYWMTAIKNLISYNKAKYKHNYYILWIYNFYLKLSSVSHKTTDLSNSNGVQVNHHVYVNLIFFIILFGDFIYREYITQ